MGPEHGPWRVHTLISAGCRHNWQKTPPPPRTPRGPWNGRVLLTRVLSLDQSLLAGLCPPTWAGSAPGPSPMLPTILVTTCCPLDRGLSPPCHSTRPRHFPPDDLSHGAGQLPAGTRQVGPPEPFCPYPPPRPTYHHSLAPPEAMSLKTGSGTTARPHAPLLKSWPLPNRPTHGFGRLFWLPAPTGNKCQEAVLGHMERVPHDPRP